MGRFIIIGFIVFLFGIILIGCNDSKPVTPVPDSKVFQEVNDFQKFTTDDGKVEILLFNKGSFSKDIIHAIQDETRTFYNAIQNADISINPPSTIYVHLYDEQKVSYTNDNTIHLYWVKEGNYPLVHELSHIFFGYTEGHLTQEGLAVFMQDSYSEKGAFPNFQINIHEIMNFLLNKEIRIPLKVLLSNEQFFEHTKLTKDSYLLRWLAYIESASFTNFLVNQYGMEKFLQIYNQPNLEEVINKVYAREVDQLESEWIEFVEKQDMPNQETIQHNEYQLNEIINHLETNKNQLFKY